MRCEVTGDVFDLSAIVDQITNAQEDVDAWATEEGYEKARDEHE